MGSDSRCERRQKCCPVVSDVAQHRDADRARFAAELSPQQHGRMTLAAFIGLPDGTRLARASASAAAGDAEGLGHRVGERLLADGGRDILALLGAPTTGREKSA